MTKRSKSETWISSCFQLSRTVFLLRGENFSFGEDCSYFFRKVWTNRNRKLVGKSLFPRPRRGKFSRDGRKKRFPPSWKPRESKQQRFDKCEWSQLKWKAWKLRVARMQIRIERGYPGHHLGRTCFLFWHRWSTRFITVRAHLFISNPRREFLDSGFDHPTFSSFPSNRRVHCTRISIHRAEDRF